MLLSAKKIKLAMLDHKKKLVMEHHIPYALVIIDRFSEKTLLLPQLLQHTKALSSFLSFPWTWMRMSFSVSHGT